MGRRQLLCIGRLGLYLTIRASCRRLVDRGVWMLTAPKSNAGERSP